MKRYAAFVVAVLIVAACGEHRSINSKPSRPTVAIEFLPPRGLAGEEDLLPVPENGGVGTEIAADPLPGTNTAPAKALSLGFESKGGKVTATVYVIGPDSDPLRWSDGHKHLVGRYSARVHESIALNELSKLGYQPITLKVVPYTPPPPAHPALITKVPSLQIALVDPDRQSYMLRSGSCTVVLHNLSSRGVVAWLISQGGNPREGSSLSSEGSYARPAIVPHGTSKDQPITFSTSGRMTPKGYVPDPPKPPQLTLAAAIFTDGSHEGDDRFAAQLEGRQVGKQVVDRIVVPFIDRIVGDSSLDDDTRTARIKEDIFRISGEPDEATTRIMREKYPDVPAADLAIELNRGLDSAKNGIWGDLYSYIHNCCQYPPPDDLSVAQWWRMARRHYEPSSNLPH